MQNYTEQEQTELDKVLHAIDCVLEIISLGYGTSETEKLLKDLRTKETELFYIELRTKGD